MAKQPEVQWQPIAHLDHVLGMVRGMTVETREQRKVYRDAAVSTLDSAAVARIRGAYADRLDLIGLFREQLGRWRGEKLSPDQERKLKELGTLLDEEERISREIQRMFGAATPSDGGAGSKN